MLACHTGGKGSIPNQANDHSDKTLQIVLVQEGWPDKSVWFFWTQRVGNSTQKKDTIVVRRRQRYENCSWPSYNIIKFT